jgi:hypothetical protein
VAVQQDQRQVSARTAAGSPGNALDGDRCAGPAAPAPPAAPGLLAALRSPGLVRPWAARRRRVLIGWAVLAAVFVTFVLTIGVPLSEDTVLLWVAAALFVSSLDQLTRWRTGILRDWLPLYVVLLGYSLLRGYASHVLWGPFVRPQLDLDQLIGFGALPTVTLQRWLFDPARLHWWDYAAWVVYTSHFFTSYTIAAVLWKRNHERFRRFIDLFVGLTFVGYAGYLLYPAMPPWMASAAGHPVALQAFGGPAPAYLAGLTGYHGATTRIIPLVWQHVGLKAGAALLTRGSEFANNVAAMPSLHAAYPMLILLFFWRRARWPVRALLLSYVLAMAFTLVYTGEHFVTDELAGWACALIVYFAGSRFLERRLARRRDRDAAAAGAQLTERPPAAPQAQA